MFGILFSLFALVGYGVSDYISSRMSKSVHPASVNLFYFFTAGVPVIIFSSFFGWPEITLENFVQFLVISFMLSGGVLLMVKAFSLGEVGVVTPIVNAYAVVTLAASVLFLGSIISLVQVLAILAVVIGIALLSYQHKSKKTSESGKSIMYAVAALIFFGLGFAGFDIVATQEWYQNAILFELTGFVASTALFLVFVKHDRIRKVRDMAGKPLYYLGGLSAAFGTVGIFLAIGILDSVAIPAAIAAASPLVTAGLAMKIDKEHLTILQRVGMVVVVSGIVAISLSVS